MVDIIPNSIFWQIIEIYKLQGLSAMTHSCLLLVIRWINCKDSPHDLQMENKKPARIPFFY